MLLKLDSYNDNTTNNPDNPSNPPVNVVAGEHTTDEMMITFLAYTPYQIGDENIVLDSAIFENVQSNSFQNQRNFIYPNPTSNTININNSKEFSSYAISSADGRIIIVDNKFPADITSLESGFYFVTLYARNTQSPLIFKFLKE